MSASPAKMQFQPKSPPQKSSKAMETLQAFLDERRRSKTPVPSFEEFESRLHTLMCAVECDALGEELERFDLDVPVVEIQGVAHRQVVRCEETYFSVAGPVRVMRSLYATRTGPGEEALCPMELRAGVVDGKWTPRAAKQAIWFVAQMTPRTVADLYERLGGLTPSKSALDRLPKRVSADWEADRERFEVEVRKQEQIPAEATSVGVSLDGVLVPTKNGEAKEQQKSRRPPVAADEPLEKTGGPAGYEEVGCGTVTFYDKDGELLSTVRVARMPESKKATLKAILVAELIAVLVQRPDLKVVRLADGAKDNWTFLDALVEAIPEAQGPSVVDFWHGAGHLSDALDAAHGKKTTQARAQLEKQRHILRHDPDGVEKVIRALAFQRDQHPRNKVIKRELKYFRAHRHRMNYAEVAAQGLPIGTGSMEAACKTLATQRMKCSGMTGWTEDGGQAILTFRALIQSDRFDRAWDLLATTYKRDVTTPENVIPLRRRARP